MKRVMMMRGAGLSGGRRVAGGSMRLLDASGRGAPQDKVRKPRGGNRHTIDSRIRVLVRACLAHACAWQEWRQSRVDPAKHLQATSIPAASWL